LLLVDACEREVEVGGGGLDLELLLKEAGCTFEIAGLCAGLRDEDGGLRADLVGDGMRTGEIGDLFVTAALREHDHEAVERGHVGLIVCDGTLEPGDGAVVLAGHHGSEGALVVVDGKAAAVALAGVVSGPQVGGEGVVDDAKVQGGVGFLLCCWIAGGDDDTGSFRLPVLRWRGCVR